MGAAVPHLEKMPDALAPELVAEALVVVEEGIVLADDQLDVEPPALIRGYLRLGAKVLGPPAWDPDFNTADLPLLMRLDELAPRFRRDFLRSA